MGFSLGEFLKCMGNANLWIIVMMHILKLKHFNLIRYVPKSGNWYIIKFCTLYFKIYKLLIEQN